MNLKKTSPGCEVSQYIQEREKIFIEFITDEESYVREVKTSSRLEWKPDKSDAWTVQQSNREADAELTSIVTRLIGGAGAALVIESNWWEWNFWTFLQYVEPLLPQWPQ